MSISGKQQALELMRYVDEINLAHGGEGTKLYSTAGTRFKTALHSERFAPFGRLGAASWAPTLTTRCCRTCTRN